MANENRLLYLRALQDRAHHAHDLGLVVRELINLLIEDERGQNQTYAPTVWLHSAAARVRVGAISAAGGVLCAGCMATDNHDEPHYETGWPHDARGLAVTGGKHCAGCCPNNDSYAAMRAYEAEEGTT